MKGAGVLLGLILALAVPASAHADRVASSVDQGSYPRASVHHSGYLPKRAPRIEVKATPTSNLLEIRVDVDCNKGSDARATNYTLRSRRAPLSRRIPLTFRQADYCSVSVEASFEGYEDNRGRIALNLFN